VNAASEQDASATRKSLALLFGVALALRLAAMFALRTPQLAQHQTVWQWGHESACLAQSLVDGHGYGDPWGKGSGPSSWLTPPFPALLAGLLALFGGLNLATALALCVLQSIASAATCVLLVVLGRELAAERAGRLAGWMFAFYPLAIANSVQLVWDTTFVALALTAFLLALVRLQPTTSSSVNTGLAYGALLFLNPAPLALAPAVAWWIWKRAGDSRVALHHVASFALAAFAVCFPWMLRNASVLGAFSLRPNFGVEMRIGNHDDANGHPMPTQYHPSHVAAEFELYQELGEVEYASENMQRACTWIAAHPAEFLGLTSKRARLFWVGEWPTSDPRKLDGAATARDPASWIKFFAFASCGIGGIAALAVARIARDVRLLLVASVALFGAPYYVSHVSERYRFPIDPLLVLLCAMTILSIGDRLRARRATH
jgi:4-amino-4-deoxy-L-arabinose transferase-like glycosyltransferase